MRGVNKWFAKIRLLARLNDKLAVQKKQARTILCSHKLESLKTRRFNAYASRLRRK